MSPVAIAALGSWRLHPWLLMGLAATAWIYLRGARSVARDLPERVPAWRRGCFVAGLAVFYVAVASPLDAFAGLSLQVHMAQHFLLMMVAPPLLWLGAPALPLLHGLPEPVRREGVGPLLGSSPVHRAESVLGHPVTCWLAFVAATWLWHLPAAYQRALADPFWHEVEHASFFAGALLFWFPVIQPWPSRARWSRWTMVPYLFLASLQATVFSALFVFSDRVFYPAYEAAPGLLGLSALDDQRVAGAVMWVPGAFVLLAATMILVAHLLSPRLVRPGSSPERRRAAVPRRRTTDLLRWPVLRGLPRWRGAVQGVSLLLATIVVADGFFGPSMGAMNLAGVLPWTYVRAFVVIGLLVAGNVFCLACPFLLPRTIARRFLPADRAWPTALRSKWLAAGLLGIYLWGYEVFAPWDGPALTAWILVGYFAVPIAVDGFFRGASFCKYLCPIGQFNFVGSLLSPLEVRARDKKVCASCTTSDCIRGGPQGRGCELDLFLPTKVGNLDCTFCMDCVRACPHDNVALVPRLPASELIDDPPRASLGRLSRRLDVAMLALVVVFGAWANAAGMLEPVVATFGSVSERLGTSTPSAVFTGFAVLALVVLPTTLATVLPWWAARFSGLDLEGRALFCRLALALVPLGMAMWADHFLVHLGHGFATIVPVATRVLGDAGLVAAAPDWSMAHVMGPSSDGLLSFQILVLDVGLLVSLYLGWRVVRPASARLAQATAVLAPWATVASLLFVAGVWILFQPMEMRGMLMHP